MDEADAKEYSQSLAQIGEGWLQQVALGVKWQVPQALGMSRREWRDRYFGNLRVPQVERPDVAVELTAPADEGGMGLSRREAADVLGVDESTVREDLGSKKRAGNPASETDTKQEPQVIEPGNEPAAGFPAPSTRELLAQSDQNDWRTPRKFLDAARMVLGGIDLDPASSVAANQTVQAAVFHTEADDGLTQPWKGTVWLNPPYGGQARLFVERLVREYEVGNVTAACALLNSHPTETKWFQGLFRYSVCFVRGRIDFGGPSREVSSTSTHGSAIAYLGPRVDAFAGQFRQFGAVVRAL